MRNLMAGPHTMSAREGEPRSRRRYWAERIAVAVIIGYALFVVAMVGLRVSDRPFAAAIIGTILATCVVLATLFWKSARLWLLSAILFTVAAVVFPLATDFEALWDLELYLVVLSAVAFGEYRRISRMDPNLVLRRPS